MICYEQIFYLFLFNAPQYRIPAEFIVFGIHKTAKDEKQDNP